MRRPSASTALPEAPACSEQGENSSSAEDAHSPALGPHAREQSLRLVSFVSFLFQLASLSQRNAFPVRKFLKSVSDLLENQKSPHLYTGWINMPVTC